MTSLVHGFVRAKSPVSLACSEVKATASRMGLSVASHASSALRPRPTSLPCTSARLTVLVAAALNSSPEVLAEQESEVKPENCASAIAREFCRKGAVKLHLLLDHDGYLPSYAVITEGKENFVIWVCLRLPVDPPWPTPMNIDLGSCAKRCSSERELVDGQAKRLHEILTEDFTGMHGRHKRFGLVHL